MRRAAMLVLFVLTLMPLAVTQAPSRVEARHSGCSLSANTPYGTANQVAGAGGFYCSIGDTRQLQVCVQYDPGGVQYNIPGGCASVYAYGQSYSLTAYGTYQGLRDYRTWVWLWSQSDGGVKTRTSLSAYI